MSEDEMIMKYLSGVTKDEFGWTLEEKYNQIKPEERYLPLAMDIYKSKEAQAMQDFMMNKAPKD